MLAFPMILARPRLALAAILTISAGAWLVATGESEQDERDVLISSMRVVREADYSGPKPSFSSHMQLELLATGLDVPRGSVLLVRPLSLSAVDASGSRLHTIDADRNGVLSRSPAKRSVGEGWKFSIRMDAPTRDSERLAELAGRFAVYVLRRRTVETLQWHAEEGVQYLQDDPQRLIEVRTKIARDTVEILAFPLVPGLLVENLELIGASPETRRASPRGPLSVNIRFANEPGLVEGRLRVSYWIGDVVREVVLRETEVRVP